MVRTLRHGLLAVAILVAGCPAEEPVVTGRSIPRPQAKATARPSGGTAVSGGIETAVAPSPTPTPVPTSTPTPQPDSTTKPVHISIPSGPPPEQGTVPPPEGTEPTPAPSEIPPPTPEPPPPPLN